MNRPMIYHVTHNGPEVKCHISEAAIPFVVKTVLAAQPDAAALSSVTWLPCMLPRGGAGVSEPN